MIRIFYVKKEKIFASFRHGHRWSRSCWRRISLVLPSPLPGASLPGLAARDRIWSGEKPWLKISLLPTLNKRIRGLKVCISHLEPWPREAMVYSPATTEGKTRRPTSPNLLLNRRDDGESGRGGRSSLYVSKSAAQLLGRQRRFYPGTMLIPNIYISSLGSAMASCDELNSFAADHGGHGGEVAQGWWRWRLGQWR
ncbi:hypothetical protein NL676_021051 [Syzygium grande]|nr:hypothetical protein NL676_021051 [Syzygium grande]